jgi:hypothetical protein
MGPSPRVVLAVASVLGVGACGLDFDRYDPGPDAASVVEAGLDGPADARGGEGSPSDAAIDAAVSDATDAAQESAPNPCPPMMGVVAAPQPSGTITIDGNLGDWGSPAYTTLDANDAALIVGPNGDCTAANATSQCLVPSSEQAEFALLHDASNLYLAVRITVPSVGGTNTTAPYLNDAVEVYLRGDAVATGNYTNDDHQYVVDWQNLVLDYGPSANDTPVTNPPGVTTAVKVGGGGWVLEMSVALTQLGRSALTPGQTLGFDVAVDHGQGTTATRSYLAWWMAMHAPPTCTTAKCTNCTPDQPYCDTLDFGAVCAD